MAKRTIVPLEDIKRRRASPESPGRFTARGTAKFDVSAAELPDLFQRLAEDHTRVLDRIPLGSGEHEVDVTDDVVIHRGRHVTVDRRLSAESEMFEEEQSLTAVVVRWIMLVAIAATIALLLMGLIRLLQTL